MDSAVLYLILIANMIMCACCIKFSRQKRTEKPAAPVRQISYAAEEAQLKRLRSISLNRPLSERLRPASFDDIIGQADGINALRALMCGPEPQHVIIYGPPGVGKTCAARLALEEAKSSPGTPFAADAPFIEVDGACMRYDERGIADPLLGSVHDPIYQGAGRLGQCGTPQPKPGAVTRAHGGVLFIDEIGELHPAQLNRLLKVLEDGAVRFESSYYDPCDESVPSFIRDVFENGMPADFRLIAATTRRPEELPPALRSRVTEISFSRLSRNELRLIAERAARRAGYCLEDSAAALLASHTSSGRDAAKLVGLICSVRGSGSGEISYGDVVRALEISGRINGYTQPLLHRKRRPARHSYSAKI